MTTTVILSLTELEAYDPMAPAHGGRELRFCCPLPSCREKRRDAAHRSLAVNAASGDWYCHRCNAGGRLREWWIDRPREDPRARHRARVRRLFSFPAGGGASVAPRTAAASRDVPPTALRSPSPRREAVRDELPSHRHRQPSLDWRQRLNGTRPLHETPGARYLAGRGIDVSSAHGAGVRYSDDWFGRPAILFPVYDAARVLVGAQGRYVDGGERPKTRSAGSIRDGLFATPGALAGEPWVITEAPLDALSLAAVGCPAVALLGTGWPEWLIPACAFRRVLIATDADEAGDQAACKLSAALAPLGARVARLRPWRFKDWNELLSRDPRGLQAAFAELRSLRAA